MIGLLSGVYIFSAILTLLILLINEKYKDLYLISGLILISCPILNTILVIKNINFKRMIKELKDVFI